MSGFDPVFDPAGTGARDGAVPHPGAIDGVAYFLRADGTWAIPPTVPPVPPPPSPGPTLDQWACNLAGWMVYDGVYAITKVAINGVGLPILGDAISIVVGGLLATFWPELIAMDAALATAIGDYITTWITGHVATFATAILDPVIWSKIHCYVFGLIEANPTALNVALGAASASAMVALGIPSQVAGGVALLLQKFGFHSFLDVPLSAFVREYDCSNCAITHQSDGGIVTGIVDDLSVSDGTTTVPVVHALHFVDATVSGTPPTATVTPNNATASTVGVSRPDNSTLGVAAGVLSVLNGQLATINLAQLGAVAATASSGVTISGLVVGRTYALQNTGLPYIYDNAGDTALSFDVSVDGSTWQGVLDYGVTGFLVGPTVTKPSWAISAGMTDSKHARVVWVATATSVRFRASATDYTQASLTLGWQLLNVEFEGSSILVEHGGTKVATRPVLDIVDSSTVTATITDDSANDRVMVSLAATAPGGGSVGTVTSVTGTAPVAVATGTTTPVVSVGVFDGHGGSHPTGLVPDPGSGGATTTFLRADGTYTVPPGTGGAGTVTGVTASAPLASSGGTAPNLTLTTPLAAQYGGTGIDTSGVNDGDLLVGTSSHTWVRGGMGGGAGISVTELGGIFTIAATGSGAGGTGWSLLGTTEIATPTAANISVVPPVSGSSHLCIVLEARGDTAADIVNLLLQFNGDTAAHYDWNAHYGSGSSSPAQESMGVTSMQLGWITGATSPAGEAALIEIWLYDYLGTNWNKQARSLHHMRRNTPATNMYTSHFGGTWQSTAAITSILLLPVSGNFVQHTKIWVYGVA